MNVHYTEIDSITTFEKKSKAQEFIDLGLSVKWGECNVGAVSI